MKVLDQQHGNQCCSNLSVESVFAGPNEGLDFQILLQGLEEKLYLPAVLVDGRYVVGSEFKMAGEQIYFPFVFSVPNYHSAKDVRAVFLSIETVESDQLIPEHVAGGGNEVFLQDGLICILLQPGDKKDTLLRPGAEQLVLIVPSIHCDSRSRGQWDLSGNGHIMLLAVGNVGIGGEAHVMIQEEMQVDRTFGSTELSPRKKRQAKRYGA